MLLLLLLRPTPLRIPPGTPGIRAPKVTVILLLGRRRARRRRRRHVSLGHILRPLVLLLLLGRLPPRLVLRVLWRRRGEELLVRGRRDGVVLVLGWVIALTGLVLVLGLLLRAVLLVGFAAGRGLEARGGLGAAVGLLG